MMGASIETRHVQRIYSYACMYANYLCTYMHGIVVAIQCMHKTIAVSPEINLVNPTTISYGLMG